VIRLQGKDTERIIDLAEHILNKWRGYTDEEAFIFAETDGTPHSTITPIARKRGDLYELDLTLRNNITTEEHPLGVYHPHAKLHHIKKENIGLIEVMGLAVLPSRLKKELAELDEPFSGFLIDNEVSDSMQVHGVDDDNLDLDSEDAADGDIDVDLDGDDELGFDEGGEMGDDGLDDFDEE